LDSLPSVDEIKQAILTLRQGENWYRIFQSRWRRAVGIHKSLLRKKVRMPVTQRLNQLEEILKLTGLKRQWQTSSTWEKFLSIEVPAAPRPLDGYLAMANWNHQVKLACEEIQNKFIETGTLTADELRSLRKEYASFHSNMNAAVTAFSAIKKRLTKIPSTNESQIFAKAIDRTLGFNQALKSRLDDIDSLGITNATFSQILDGCQAARTRLNLEESIRGNTYVKSLLKEFYSGVNTDCVSVIKTLQFAQGINALELEPLIKQKILSGHPIEFCGALTLVLEKVYVGLSKVETLKSELSSFGKFELNEWVGVSAELDFNGFLIALGKRIQQAIQDRELLIPWSLYLTRSKEAYELTLGKFVELLETKKVSTNELTHSYAYCFYGSIAREAFRNIPELGRFTGLKHNQIREEFKRLDKEIISLRGKVITSDCSRKTTIPRGINGARVDDKRELHLLHHLIPQLKPRMPVRKMELPQFDVHTIHAACNINSALLGLR
jgi:hypothetical protein